MATFVIKNGGNDAASGADDANAWEHLSKIDSSTSALDTIYVKDGTYSAQDGATGAILYLNTVGPRRILGYTTTLGDGGTFGGVIVDADVESLTNAGLITAVADWNLIRGFEFRGASSHGCNVVSGNLHTSFQRCEFNNNGAYGLYCNGGSAIIVSCSADLNVGYGIYVINRSHISSCVISNTATGYGVNIGAQSSISHSLIWGNSSGQISSVNDTLVEFCTIDGRNVYKGIIFSSTNAGNGAKNNIIYDCTVGITGVINKYQGSLSSGNLFFSNATDRTYWPTDPSDIAADPLFVDAANNDYRLQTGSPALEAGMDAGEVIRGASFPDVGAEQKEAIGGPIKLAGEGGLVG